MKALMWLCGMLAAAFAGAAATAPTVAITHVRVIDTTGAPSQPGKLADLVLLDANPLEDIANADKIRAVVLAGRYLDRAELDRMLKGVAEAAADTSHAAAHGAAQ